MSEFDSEFSTVIADEDPAADFFAREQDQLAGLDDGFEGSATVTGDEFGSADFTVKETAFDPFTQQEPSMANQYLSLDDATVTASSTDDGMYAALGVADTGDFAYGESETTFVPVVESGFAAISLADKQRAEPEGIRLWREEQAKQLKIKDEESEKRADEWREQARKELEEWYRHREEQLAKTRVNNKDHEAILVQEREETTPGHEWERICRLCEFNPKHTGNKKDVARMRSILLQLKQTPLQKSA